jgi:hypothetical protein
MSSKKARICALCGTQYEFCPQCNPKDAEKPTWYFTFCSENCHDIYAVASGFEDGRIKDFNAKTQLEKLDLSKLNNFGESYKTSIAKIKAISVAQPKKKEVTQVVNESFSVNDKKNLVRKPKNEKVDSVE